MANAYHTHAYQCLVMMLLAPLVAPIARGKVSAGRAQTAGRSAPVFGVRKTTVVASIEPREQAQSSTVSRRSAVSLAGLALVGGITQGALPASADDEYITFYGAANPPATYGGVGGTTRDKARYSFVVPSGFKEDAVSKVDKGTSGIDSRFLSGGRKKESVIVITLRNEGSRDGQGFVLKDADTSLKTVAGALFALQDAIAAGTVASRPAESGGGFKYEISGGPTNYAAWVTTSKDGRLFAIFVGAPDAGWQADKAELIKIRDSFKVYDGPA